MVQSPSEFHQPSFIRCTFRSWPVASVFGSVKTMFLGAGCPEMQPLPCKEIGKLQGLAGGWLRGEIREVWDWGGVSALYNWAGLGWTLRVKLDGEIQYAVPRCNKAFQPRPYLYPIYSHSRTLSSRFPRLSSLYGWPRAWERG